MKKSIYILAILSVVVLSSCRKDRFDDPKTPEKMEELTVPASFDWKTTKDVQLTLSANANGIVEVMNASNISYQKAFLTPAQPYVMKLTIPSYEKSVKLRFQGKEASLEIGSGNLSYNFQ